MPQLKQPKDLSYLCYSSISIFISKRIIEANEIQLQAICEAVVASVPVSILELLAGWVFQSANMVLNAVNTDVWLDADDGEIVADHCRVIKRCLQLFSKSKIRFFETDYVIDMRTFSNFASSRVVDPEQQVFPEQDESNLVIATEQGLAEVPEVKEICDLLSESFEQGLASFNAKWLIRDRPNQEDDDDEEMGGLSLCWAQPRSLINLVRKSQETLTMLNLEGYEELNDLAIDFLCGLTDEKGLEVLTELTLPKKCHVTVNGLKVILENLKVLERLKNAGNLGLVFDDPTFMSSHPLKLMDFEQTRSLPADGELLPWKPDIVSVMKLLHVSPQLEVFRILSDDRDLATFAEVMTNMEEEVAITEAEIHSVYNGFSTGLDLLAIALGDYLTSLTLTLLEGYTWTVLTGEMGNVGLQTYYVEVLKNFSVIGTQCEKLERFHIEFWSEELEDEEALEDIPNEYFNNLQDLKVKCKEFVERLTSLLFKNLLNCSSESLTIIQVSHPIKDQFRHKNINGFHSMLLLWIG